jgi:hypothetical protein
MQRKHWDAVSFGLVTDDAWMPGKSIVKSLPGLIFDAKYQVDLSV